MPRRANHEGNIRQRDEGAWEASTSFHGRRYYVRGSTRAEAQRKLAELHRAHGLGELVPPSRATVAQHLAAWLEAARPDLKPKTLREYESVAENYLLPAFGHVPLQKLTAPMLARQFARWKAERPVTGKTLLNVYRTLNRALVFAVRWGLVGRNPLGGVEPPKATRYRPQLWTPDEAVRFLSSIGEARWDCTLAVMLLGTGARFGEILAARWSDYTRDTGELAIRHNLARIHGRYVEGTPKTESGTRTVMLPAFAVEHLARWRPVQVAERLAAGPAWASADRIITLPEGPTPLHRKAYDAFHALCSGAGVPETRLHDLRHLHASLLLAEGLPLPAVSARLGHANSAVTASIYSHALKGQDAKAALAIEAALYASR